MNKKRIFIGLKVEAGEALKEMISSLKSVLNSESIKWTIPDNIHITLVFIGDTEENRIKSISAMLKEKCEGSGRFELTIKGSGVFKSPGDPRVIWTGIGPSEKLTLLNKVIIDGLKETGISVEERSFKPHLTLGRIKYLNDKELLKSLIDKYQNRVFQKVPVNEVILYESILLHSGPVYKHLYKVELL